MWCHVTSLVDRWRTAGLENSSEMHSGNGGSKKWLETEGQTEENKYS